MNKKILIGFITFAFLTGQIGTTYAFFQNPTSVSTSSISAAGGAVLDTNVFTGPQTIGGGNASATISNILASPSWIPNANTYIDFPSPANLALGNCPGFAGVTNKNICLQDLYNSQFGNSSGTVIRLPAYRFASSSADVPVNFNNNGETVTLQCAPGEGTLWEWGNATNTPEFTWNVGAGTGSYATHIGGYGMVGCNMTNQSGNASSVLALFGGSSGSEGFTADHNILRGFYQGFTFGANTYIVDISYNRFINDQYPIYYSNQTNSGENFMIIGNLFGDGPIEPCQVYIDSVPIVNFQYNDFDDCQHVIGPTVYAAVLQGNYYEDPGANGTSSNQPAYARLVVQTSTHTNVFIDGMSILEDTGSTTSTPSVFIQNSGNIYGQNIVVTPNGNATTVAAFASNSNAANFKVCNLINQTGGSGQLAFTNVLSAGGTSLLSLANSDGNPCVQRTAGSFGYSSPFVTSGNTVEQFFDGIINQITIPVGGSNGSTLQAIGAGAATSTADVKGTLGLAVNIISSSTTIPTNSAGNNYVDYIFNGSVNSTLTFPLNNLTQNRFYMVGMQTQTGSVTLTLQATSTDLFWKGNATSTTLALNNDQDILIHNVGGGNWQVMSLFGALNGLSGDITIAGTANEITVATSSATITLSTPQAIGTSSNVQFANVTSTNVAITAHRQFPTSSVSVSVCGAGASIVGSDNGGIITTGSSSLGCTVTFAVPWVSIPVCMAISATNTAMIIRTEVISTSSFHFGDSTNFPTSTTLSYMCQGNPN